MYTIAKLIAMRLLIAFDSSLNPHLHQLDVHNAFLYGDLDKEVYMILHQGIHSSHPNQVCKLLKTS